MRSGSMDGSIYLTSSATQRKWTERQYLLCSTLAPAMASILAVSVRYTCGKTHAAYVSFGRWRKQGSKDRRAASAMRAWRGTRACGRRNEEDDGGAVALAY